MAPTCGLCEGEMTDLDFHLEGKCQNSITGVTEHPEIGGLCKILGPQGPVYGTETCDHRCHLPKDGNLQFGFEHPRHCCTCDGSRPILATRWTMVDEAASPVKDINWAIDANFPPIKSWTCKHGHNYRGVEVKWAVMDGEGKTARSGPLCPLCLLDFVNREFPAFEAKDG